mmetsp:Transcript_27931/g.82111  ORF Transcript_27931/g.82111 Transcript_27931/m.82111 type:complete len:238 (+) Transcript_27931:1651-2364(+)
MAVVEDAEAPLLHEVGVISRFAGDAHGRVLCEEALNHYPLALLLGDIGHALLLLFHHLEFGAHHADKEVGHEDYVDDDEEHEIHHREVCAPRIAQPLSLNGLQALAAAVHGVVEYRLPFLQRRDDEEGPDAVQSAVKIWDGREPCATHPRAHGLARRRSTRDQALRVHQLIVAVYALRKRPSVDCDAQDGKQKDGESQEEEDGARTLDGRRQTLEQEAHCLELGEELEDAQHAEGPQ